MKKPENSMKNIKCELPHIGLVLVFSIICSIIKSIGCTSYDWIHVMLTIPICLYFLWTLGFVISVVLISVSAKAMAIAHWQLKEMEEENDK